MNTEQTPTQMGCTVCGSDHHNRSACPLEKLRLEVQALSDALKALPSWGGGFLMDPLNEGFPVVPLQVARPATHPSFHEELAAHLASRGHPMPHPRAGEAQAAQQALQPVAEPTSAYAPQPPTRSARWLDWLLGGPED